MRTIVTHIYKYEELPTAKAKKAARDWWWSLEKEDPAWHTEHWESYQAIVNVFERSFNIEKLIERCHNLELTGYCADAVAGDHIKERYENGKEFDTLTLKRAFQKDWDEEMRSRNNKEYIEENIIANEYEFTEDGIIF